MSITPESAPFRPAYVRDSTGLYYRIGGGSTEAGPSVDVQPPSIPTGFVTNAVSTTGFTITWAAATDNVGVTGYEVERNGVAVATTAGTTYTASGLPASTPYTIRVRARDIAGNWSGWSLGYSVTTSTPAAYVYVVITTNGTAFAPSIETTGTLTGTIDWLDASDVVLATGATPTMNFGSVASRVIRMRVQGADAARIRSVNLGFNNGDDQGRESIGASYNWPAQPVTGIAGLTQLPNLVNFMAANTPLTGFVDFTGLANLRFVECFYAHVNSVNFTGCTSMRRICFERNDFDPAIPLDLNPIAATIYDIRAANSRGPGGLGSGTLRLATLTADFPLLYHWCIRDQAVINHPPLSRFPVVVEFWIWGTPGAGSGPANGLFQLVSDLAYDVRGSGTGSGWNIFDDVGRHPSAATALGGVDFNYSGLSNVLLHSYSQWNVLQFTDNPGLTTTTIDSMLSIINGWNTSGGVVNLIRCSPPSSGSVSVIAALRARNWTVTTEPPLAGPLPVPVAGISVSPAAPQATVAAFVSSTSTNAETWNWNFGAGATPATATTAGPHSVTWATTGSKTVTLAVTNPTGSDNESVTFTVGAAPAVGDLWTDTFDRSAANVAAMGQGWNVGASTETAMLDGDNLIRTGSGSYTRLLTPTTYSGGLPSNIGIEVVAPQTTWVIYSGIALRVNSANAYWGIKAFMLGPTQCVVGNAESWATDNQVLVPVNGFPASWTNAGDHSFRLEARGMRADVFADGTHVGYFICDPLGQPWANDGLPNLQVGLVGDAGGSRIYRSIRVFPVTGTAP